MTSIPELEPLNVAYTHGPLLWKVALGVLLVAGALIARAIPAIGIARRARASRRALSAPVLRGTLADGKTVRTDDGELVELDGPIEVIVGSCESRGPLPRAVTARLERTSAIASAPTPTQPFLRAVMVGDRVAIYGALEEVPRGEASYRARSIARVVRPARHATSDAARDAIGVVAERRPRIAKHSVGRPLAGALTGALVFLALFGFGGAVAAQRAMSMGSGDGDRFSANAFAAATPLHRDAALHRLATSLLARERVDGPRTQRAAAIELERGSCNDAVEALIARPDPAARRDALALATRCQLPERAAESAWIDGDFARASASWSASPHRGYASTSEVAAHMLAGDFRAAATATGRLTRVNDGRWSRGDADAREQGLGCLERYLLARAGARYAREAAAWDDPVASWECSLLHRDLEPAATRRPVDAGSGSRLSTVGASGAYDQLSALQLLLELETEPRKTDGLWVYYDVSELAVDGRLVAMSRPVALERAMLESPRASELHPRVRIQLARSVAAFESFFGDDAAARHRIDGVLDDLRDHTGASTPASDADARNYGNDSGAGDAAAIALLAGDRSRVAALAPASSMVQRLALGQEDFRRYDGVPWWYPPPQTWTLAARGDATSLARELRTSDPSDGHAALFFFGERLASHVALRDWLHWAAPVPCRTCGIRAMAPAASFRRRSATALGDRELAADAAAIETRFREALLRRDVAVPLAILEILNPETR
jgi:hypothetical protein